MARPLFVVRASIESADIEIFQSKHLQVTSLHLPSLIQYKPQQLPPSIHFPEGKVQKIGNIFQFD